MRSPTLAQSLSELLSGQRYVLYATTSTSEFFGSIEQHQRHLDCLVVQDNGSLLSISDRLYSQGTLLPVVILPEEIESPTHNTVINKEFNLAQSDDAEAQAETNFQFHPAEVRLNSSQLIEIEGFLDKAIAKFLSLSTAQSLSNPPNSLDFTTELTTRSLLMQQQRRLSEKLKERLGYLSVYYKRNPQLFLRHLPQNERQKLLENLKSEYRLIVLKYFSQDSTLNQKIDNFVDKAFFADVSVTRIVEIHMELMEEFAKQLKLEGRSEEVLLDYRLTLIDVIAHLGEMYRRSIPKDL